MLKISVLLLIIAFTGCTHPVKNTSIANEVVYKIKCNDFGCLGSYEGVEFVNGSDVAHQLSNRISGVVGDKLKELYRNQLYSKVDFRNIEMSTSGMGSGLVKYTLSIPIMRVKERCDSYTSFDHVGGWNHRPALLQRKQQLNLLLKNGEELFISELKTTAEGLQEYWIQWKHKETQSDCQ